MSQVVWKQVQSARRARYATALRDLGVGLANGLCMKCPDCRGTFWMTLPIDGELYEDGDQIQISCAGTCGYFGNVTSFAPIPTAECPEGFDTRLTCRYCKVDFAVNGVFVRRPCCAIENPRELMADVVGYVTKSLAEPAGRQTLEMTLGLLVSKFDGIMRGMLKIANQNSVHVQEGNPKKSDPSCAAALPRESSFQNIAAARERLLPACWDMASPAADWEALKRLFQKRHTIAHGLGVADQHYISRSSDQTAVLGKRVSLTSDELLTGARDCKKIVDSFFGHFLS